MTTTKTRPKKTTKKKTGKKPKWTLISFKKIEGWREKLGLTITGMAEALGVTNSTYHNWKRGTTVPHPNQQEDIVQRIDALEKNAGTTSESAGDSGKKAGQPTSHSTKGRSGSSGSFGSGEGSGNRGGLNGAGRGRGSASTDQGVASSDSLSMQHKVPRDDVAAITVAFIQAQKKTVSADAVIGFVTQLREVL